MSIEDGLNRAKKIILKNWDVFTQFCMEHCPEVKRKLDIIESVDFRLYSGCCPSVYITDPKDPQSFRAVLISSWGNWETFVEVIPEFDELRRITFYRSTYENRSNLTTTRISPSNHEMIYGRI